MLSWLVFIIMLFSFIHFFPANVTIFLYSRINLHYVCGMHLPHACVGEGGLVPGPGCCDKVTMIMHVEAVFWLGAQVQHSCT